MPYFYRHSEGQIIEKPACVVEADPFYFDSPFVREWWHESDLLRPLNTPAPPMRDVSGKAAYELGNCLRGWYLGRFWTDQEAWDALSERFDRGFPSHKGREVELRKVVRQGVTKGGNAPRDPFYAKLREGMAEQGFEVTRVSPVRAR